MVVFKQKAVRKILAQQEKQKKYTILVVDDEKTIVDNLADRLSEEYRVITAFDGEDALTQVRAQPPDSVQIIIADQRMPRLSGVEFLEQTLSIMPKAKRIVLTGYSDIEAVISAINRAQVYRFIMKPWDPDKMMATLKLALEAYEAEQREDTRFEEIVGSSPALHSCLDRIRQIAATPAPVLILGESGTGKELFAKAIYRESDRNRKPFVTVHCAALPENLMESELFGHRRGAFTGAHTDRAGRITQANGGTLFLDEVGEIPLPIQAKLLRFFQFGEIQPVGFDRVEKVDVRIVTATHRDLKKMVEEGSFRQDLYYRLKVVEIELPPLRKRQEDIPLLVHFFLRKYWQRDLKPVLSEETLMLLQGYQYPGNVRELAHLMERACLLASGREITPNLLPPEVLQDFGKSPAGEAEAQFNTLTNEELKDARHRACRRASNQVERQFLVQLLDHHQDVADAARFAGMQRTYLHRLLTKHRLREP